jgi:hypothetical protein
VVTREVGRRAQAKIQNIARQNNRVEHPAHGFKEVVRASSAGGSIVDPVAADKKSGLPDRRASSCSSGAGLPQHRHKAPDVSGACFNP